MTNKSIHYSQLTKSAVLDYSGTHSLNAHTNCISNFNIRNRLSALTSFARQRLASLYRKSAFTLAETLIVMGIIGVVAALTLPNLNSSTGDKEKVAKVKKVYSNLEDAIGRAQAVYGPVSDWFVNYNIEAAAHTKRFAERITEFMKLSKNCEQTANLGCFSKDPYKNLDGNAGGIGLDSADWGPSGAYRVITADGTSIFFNYVSSLILVDIDGPNKGANTWGKDLFCFQLDINTKEPLPGGYNFTDEQLKNNCFKTGQNCTAWVIQNDNMDYLKVDNSGKCTNNTSIVLDGTTNTTCK